MIIINSAGRCDFHSAGRCDLQVPVISTIGRGPKGPKGDKGDPGDDGYAALREMIDELSRRVAALEQEASA